MTTSRQTLAATQKSTIKDHLMRGETISKWEAYERYQITCLAQRVHELRRSGLDIKSEVTVKNGKRFSLYWIEQKERTRYEHETIKNKDGVIIFDASDRELREANLTNADLKGRNLKYKKMYKVNLSHADLRNADLSYAVLRLANLRFADLRGANLDNADLRGADLSFAKTN